MKRLFISVLCLTILLSATSCTDIYSAQIEPHSYNPSNRPLWTSTALVTTNSFSPGYKPVLPSDDTLSDAWIYLDDNIPGFTADDITTNEFETYSPLDSLGRCGVAFANISPATMPTEERESIGMIKPTGWHTVKYDCVDGKYLYNRCHLIGFQLAGENANELNLITGTRYLNIEGMLDFENEIADYVRDTGNHVLYRVTPLYSDDNLLCDGVQMEAYSVEDDGEGICFNVFAYNIQPGVEIDYATGDSWLAD